MTLLFVTVCAARNVTDLEIIYVNFPNVRKPFRKFPDQENAKFMSLLKQQYTLNENDAHDFDAVREKFAEHDKSGTGIVTRQQVRENLNVVLAHKHHVKVKCNVLHVCTVCHPLMFRNAHVITS